MNRDWVGEFVGDEEPCAALGLVGEVSKNGDAAGAGASGEVGRVVVDSG